MDKFIFDKLFFFWLAINFTLLRVYLCLTFFFNQFSFIFLLWWWDWWSRLRVFWRFWKHTFELLWLYFNILFRILRWWGLEFFWMMICPVIFLNTGTCIRVFFQRDKIWPRFLSFIQFFLLRFWNIRFFIHFFYLIL